MACDDIALIGTAAVGVYWTWAMWPLIGPGKSKEKPMKSTGVEQKVSIPTSSIPRIHLIRQKVIPFNAFTQDMAVMLEWLGITYELVDTDEFMVRTSYVDTRYRMEIATRLTKPQKRFAIAHAIGHLVLHEIPSGIFTDKNLSKDTPLEREANIFACDLLVPLRTSEPIFRAFEGNDEKLAEFFQVPKDAIKIQVIRLLTGRSQ